MDSHLLCVTDDHGLPPPRGMAVDGGRRARCPPVKEAEGLQRGEVVGLAVLVKQPTGTVVILVRALVWQQRRLDVACCEGHGVGEQGRARHLAHDGLGIQHGAEAVAVFPVRLQECRL